MDWILRWNGARVSTVKALIEILNGVGEKKEKIIGLCKDERKKTKATAEDKRRLQNKTIGDIDFGSVTAASTNY